MEGGHGYDAANAPERLLALPSRLLNLAAGYAQRQVGDRLATLGARKWHYAALAALDEFGPDSQSGLSDRTGIYRSDMVATINELTARGFVVRAPDPEDRRRNAITLTDEGRRHLEQLDALIAEGEEEFFGPLSTADRAELIRILQLIVEPSRTALRPRRSCTGAPSACAPSR